MKKFAMTPSRSADGPSLMTITSSDHTLCDENAQALAQALGRFCAIYRNQCRNRGLHLLP